MCGLLEDPGGAKYELEFSYIFLAKEKKKKGLKNWTGIKIGTFPFLCLSILIG